MHIRDIFREHRTTFSFEFFPPKTDPAAEELFTTVAHLQELRPSFVSVTYGAGGSTRERTHDLVVRIQKETSLTAVAHLTSVCHSRADLAAILDRYAASGVDNVLALGGDPPEVTGPLETVAARALELAAWREDPMRAVASVPDIDRGAAIQDRLHGAYARFMRASDPLVAVQDTLPDGLVAALRDVEEAAARAGAADRLAERLAAAMSECDDGAGQMLDADVRGART